MADAFDAVVLAGGSARRLGGVDKPAVLVGDRTLLDRVLAAVEDAATVVVVGPRRETERHVQWVREEPPGGGPVAALAAALPYVVSPLVAVLAADLPFLDRSTVRRLRDAIGSRDGALLVDADGRDQLLVGVWRTTALQGALTQPVQGARLGSVLGRLDYARVSVDAVPAPWFDCDTEADLTTAREHA